MKARLRVQDPIGLPTIRAGHDPCCQASLRHRLNLVAAYPGCLTPGGKPWFISRGCHRHHDLGFTRAATATFAWFGAAVLNIIQFDQPGHLAIGMALRHGLADLMSHEPHRFISSDLQDPWPRQQGGAAFLSPPSGRSSKTIFSGASWSYEKSFRPSARSGNYRLCRRINDASDESKLGRADNDGTANPEANTTETDAFDKLSRS